MDPSLAVQQRFNTTGFGRVQTERGCRNSSKTVFGTLWPATWGGDQRRGAMVNSTKSVIMENFH